MASINKAIIVGNLGRDPETRYLADGQTAVCNLTVATTRKFKDKSGELNSETEWHRVTFFGRLAEVAQEYLHKGSCCYVEGRLRTRKYTDKDGVEKYATEILGEQLQLLDRRASADQPRQAPATSSSFVDDDPPF